MSIPKQLLISLLLAAAIFGVFSWPLFRHFGEGIPHTSTRGEAMAVRQGVMGDHLQLLFHFWLAEEWFSGSTPMGQNPYTFNLGDDLGEKVPPTDYLPFSGVFALLNGPLPRAAAWNLTILFSLWMSHFFIACLLLTYGASAGVSIILATVAFALPYQWATAFGGSPTGFAMMAIPMLLLGLERALRQASWAGGLLAAVGLLVAFWTDGHLILFSLMLGPMWALLVLIHDDRIKLSNAKDLARRIATASPVIIMAVFAVVQRLKTKAALSGSLVGGGREWREVALFSPHARGLVAHGTTGHDHTIYLGGLLLFLVALGAALTIRQALRSRAWHRLVHVALLGGGVAALIAFALGTNGPDDAIVLRAARKLLPPIGMIRQPAKVFGLLAPLLAVLALPAWTAMTAVNRRGRVLLGLPLLVAAMILLSYKMEVRPGIALIDAEQQAYAAVAADAAESGIPPRAVGLPIWPGDSAWTSLYQHDASLYRVHLINGYVPGVSREYIETIYQPLDSLNCGLLNDDQIRFLEERGFRYLIFHEDAFPEQVSWFPAGYTLKRLLTHPRLALLKQDGSVWAFRIIAGDEAPDGRRDFYPLVADWSVFGSRIQSEMEHEKLSGGATAMEDDTASAGRFVRLSQPGDAARLSPFDHLNPDLPVLLIRVRGTGSWNLLVQHADRELAFLQSIDTQTWTWVTIPLRSALEASPIQPGVTLESGTVDVDRIAYVSGLPPRPSPGEEVLIPAAVFHHAGYTDLETGSVVLRARYEPGVRLFYGPRWPLPEGDYEAELIWQTAPPDGIAVGTFELQMGDFASERIPATGGRPTILRFSTKGRSQPLEFGFHYTRTADVAIRGIKVRRIE